MRKKFLLVLSLFAGLCLHAQRITYDTTFSGWNVLVTYDPSADSTEGIIFMPGLGEVGTDTSKIALYGPHYWLRNGWDGSVPMGNGVHYPILITIQQLYANSQPTWIKPTMDGILARYKIKRNALHMISFSNGNMCLSGFATYQPAVNDYSYMSLMKSIVDIQGQNPATSYGASLPFPQKFGHWAAKFGTKFLGFEQTGDTRDIWKITNNMNDSVPNSAFFLWTTFGSSGHSNFNDYMDPAQNNWTLSNPEVQWRKPLSSPTGRLSIPIEGGQNVYQWMLRQGDTLMAGSLVNVPPTANAGLNDTITLPVDSVQLSGSGADSDGPIVSYLWSKISGGTATIANAGSPTTMVNGLEAGNYVFTLTVTDDSSATATDTVLVTVLPAVPDSGPKYINVNIYTTNPYSHGEWNDWTFSTGSNKVSGLFNYSDTTASTVYATLSYNNGINDNYSGYGAGATMAPAEVLRYTSYSSANRTLTLSGLSVSKEYSIELYASRRTDGNPTIFTVAGISDTINTYYNTTDAAIFTGLTPDVSGNIVVSIGKINSFTYLNGFRITETVSSARGKAVPAVVKKGQGVLADAASSISIYPNPVGNELFFELKTSYKGTFSVSILDLGGKTGKQFFFTKDAGKFRRSVDIGSLAPGTYMMVIQEGGNRYVSKFIKQ